MGVRVASAAVLLTAWVPAGIAAWEIVQIMRAVPDAGMLHYGTPVFFVVTAILLSLVVSPLLRGRGWARSVVLTWLLIFAFSATTLMRSLGPLGWAGVAVAVAGVVALAVPASWAYFTAREFPPDEPA